jgi:hypothetical protein
MFGNKFLGDLTVSKVRCQSLLRAFGRCPVSAPAGGLYTYDITFAQLIDALGLQRLLVFPGVKDKAPRISGTTTIATWHRIFLPISISRKYYAVSQYLNVASNA